MNSVHRNRIIRANLIEVAIVLLIKRKCSLCYIKEALEIENSDVVEALNSLCRYGVIDEDCDEQNPETTMNLNELIESLSKQVEFFDENDFYIRYLNRLDHLPIITTKSISSKSKKKGLFESLFNRSESNS